MNKQNIYTIQRDMVIEDNNELIKTGLLTKMTSILGREKQVKIDLTYQKINYLYVNQEVTIG